MFNSLWAGFFFFILLSFYFYISGVAGYSLTQMLTRLVNKQTQERRGCVVNGRPVVLQLIPSAGIFYGFCEHWESSVVKLFDCV